MASGDLIEKIIDFEKIFKASDFPVIGSRDGAFDEVKARTEAMLCAMQSEKTFPRFCAQAEQDLRTSLEKYRLDSLGKPTSEAEQTFTTTVAVSFMIREDLKRFLADPRNIAKLEAAAGGQPSQEGPEPSGP